MTYVMILYFAISLRGETITTHEFETQESCQEAKQQILKDLTDGRWGTNYAFISCVKK